MKTDSPQGRRFSRGAEGVFRVAALQASVGVSGACGDAVKPAKGDLRSVTPVHPQPERVRVIIEFDDALTADAFVQMARGHPRAHVLETTSPDAKANHQPGGPA